MSDHYNAFISYKHAPLDSKVAEHVQRSLEHFVIPAMAAICLLLLILRPVLRNTGKKASASKSSEERK